MKQIPIFFSFDNNYVIPAAVAFYSLLNTAKENIFYDMYVLHADITADNIALLRNIINKKNNANLQFINTNGFLQKEWENSNFEKRHNSSQFTSDTIVRCFAAQFFPQYNKIIYSDVDVVFADNISELFDIDLEDKYMAAVRSAFIKAFPYELSHLKKEHYEKFKDTYFAGGIWALNLEKIRKDNLEDKMLEIIKDDGIIKRWNDQDIMNIACDNKIKFLPLNYISYPYLQDLIKRPDFVSHYTQEEMYDSIINPKIIHFAAEKPWNGVPRFADIWRAYFDYLNLPSAKIFTNKKLKFKHRMYFKAWSFLNEKLKRKGIIK